MSNNNCRIHFSVVQKRKENRRNVFLFRWLDRWRLQKVSRTGERRGRLIFIASREDSVSFVKGIENFRAADRKNSERR